MIPLSVLVVLTIPAFAVADAQAPKPGELWRAFPLEPRSAATGAARPSAAPPPRADPAPSYPQRAGEAPSALEQFDPWVALIAGVATLGGLLLWRAQRRPSSARVRPAPPALAPAANGGPRAGLTPKVHRQAVRMRARGMSATAIAHELNARGLRRAVGGVVMQRAPGARPPGT